MPKEGQGFDYSPMRHIHDTRTGIGLHLYTTYTRHEDRDLTSPISYICHEDRDLTSPIYNIYMTLGQGFDFTYIQHRHGTRNTGMSLLP